jgi:hypothetical protein
MTVSNFNWTDKNSVRWFLILPTGHEGPYSQLDLESLFSQNKLGLDVQVWAEGLSNPVPLKELFLKSMDDEEAPEDELPPPLPDIPTEDEADLMAPPSLPEEDEEEAFHGPEASLERPKRRLTFLVPLLFIVVFAFGLREWIRSSEKVTIQRYPRMSMELHQRIEENVKFDGWDKTIFFKEFTPPDLSQIWLVNAGFQHCKVEGSFSSLSGKLLTPEEVGVAFTTVGELKNHVVVFDEFKFSQGAKIIPGMYEMSIKAHHCDWDGILPTLANKFRAPEKTYEAKTNVILYGQGAEEFQKVLAEITQKKYEAELREKQIKDQFWDDLQQKLQTLLAVSLQIEQLFVDFSEGSSVTFSKRLPAMIQNYTTKFGQFLTNFVTANEEYFGKIAKTKLRELALRKDYEEMVRLLAKDTGFVSMRFIEDLQKMKNPTKAQLIQKKKSVIGDFLKLKERINQRIIEVTEDRSKP